MNRLVTRTRCACREGTILCPSVALRHSPTLCLVECPRHHHHDVRVVSQQAVLRGDHVSQAVIISNTAESSRSSPPALFPINLLGSQAASQIFRLLGFRTQFGRAQPLRIVTVSVYD